MKASACREDFGALFVRIIRSSETVNREIVL